MARHPCGAARAAERNNMSQQSTHALTQSGSTLTGGPAGNSGGTRPLRHVLDFEKPLAQLEQQILELEALQASKQTDYSTELQQLRTNYTNLLRKTYDSLSAWETVQVARHPQRPQFRDYVDM